PEHFKWPEKAIVADCGLAFDAKKLGNGWAIEIGIEDADAQPERRQRQRDIDRTGGFAHAPLARAYGEDAANAGNGGARWRAGSLLRRGGRGVGGSLVACQRDHHLAPLGDSRDRLFGSGAGWG